MAKAICEFKYVQLYLQKNITKNQVNYTIIDNKLLYNTKPKSKYKAIVENSNTKNYQNPPKYLRSNDETNR